METTVTASVQFSSFSEYYHGALSRFPQEHRNGGSFQVSMLKVKQSATELVKPAFDQLSVVGLLSESSRAEFDIGDGWRPKAQYGRDFVSAQPGNQACEFRMYDPIVMLGAAAPVMHVREQLERIGVYSDPFLRAYSSPVHKPATMQLLRAMWAALEMGGPANNLMVDGYYIAILGQMMNEEADQRAFAVVPYLAKPQLMRVIDYIEAHFDAPLLTSELAGIATMSTAQFGRSFKAATGFSPHRYVTTRRIAHAKYMLRQGQLTITQIAFGCGFSSAAHFATTFQQHVGLQPSAYRAALA